MNSISDDCLFVILDLLSINDKFVLRSVNKSWKIQLDRLLKMQKIIKYDRDTYVGDGRTLVLTRHGLTDVLPIMLNCCSSLEIIYCPREQLFIDQLLPIASSLVKICCRFLDWLEFTSSKSSRHRILMQFNNLRHIEVEEFTCPSDLAQLCNSCHDSLRFLHFNSKRWGNREFQHVINTLPSNLDNLSCVNWDPPENLEYMPFAPKLKTLKIVFLQEPFAFPNLESIECTATATPSFFHSMSISTHLKKFNVQLRSHQYFINDFALFLAKVPLLTEVSINCLQSDGMNDAVKELVNFCPSIKVLFIRWKESISVDETLCQIASLNNLIQFSLHTIQAQITSEAIYNLLEQLPKLKLLDLRWNKNIKVEKGYISSSGKVHNLIAQSIKRGQLTTFNLPVKCDCNSNCSLALLNTQRHF